MNECVQTDDQCPICPLRFQDLKDAKASTSLLDKEFLCRVCRKPAGLHLRRVTVTAVSNCTDNSMVSPNDPQRLQTQPRGHFFTLNLTLNNVGKLYLQIIASVPFQHLVAQIIRPKKRGRRRVDLPVRKCALPTVPDVKLTKEEKLWVFRLNAFNHNLSRISSTAEEASPLPQIPSPSLSTALPATANQRQSAAAASTLPRDQPGRTNPASPLLQTLSHPVPTSTANLTSLEQILHTIPPLRTVTSSASLDQISLAPNQNSPSDEEQKTRLDPLNALLLGGFSPSCVHFFSEHLRYLHRTDERFLLPHSIRKGLVSLKAALHKFVGGKHLSRVANLQRFLTESSERALSDTITSWNKASTGSINHLEATRLLASEDPYKIIVSFYQLGLIFNLKFLAELHGAQAGFNLKFLCGCVYYLLTLARSHTTHTISSLLSGRRARACVCVCVHGVCLRAHKANRQTDRQTAKRDDTVVVFCLDPAHELGK